MAPTPGYPALLTITEADLILETFSHKSLKLEYDPEMTTDNERLTELGRTTVQFAATRYLYAKRPIIRASDMPAQRDSILTAEKYGEWVNHYNLRQRLRYLPSEDIDINTPEETIDLFHAYVGAICCQHGPTNATNWILTLINPDAAIIPSSVYEQNESSDNRASKRQRSEPSSPKFSPPPVPAGPPPPVPANPSYYPIPVYNGGSQTSASGISTPIGHQATPPTPRSPRFLPMLNQKCAQLHMKVEYQAANHGQAHAPRWMIQCFVNNIMKGHGEGASKQVAKEAAATMAYHSMGWAASA